jgi:pimeloyl-ACP methyl ester carboxylesterase
VIALPWPGREATVEELQRRHPDPTLGRLGYGAVVDHHAKAIASLGARPIIIGHSMGGLVTQSLIQRDLGSVGVAIDTAPPRGVSSAEFSFLRANWPVVNPLLPSSRPYRMSFPRFQYAFVNGMPIEDQRRVYETQTVPESLRVPRESRGRTAAIDFHRDHAPLLLTAGSSDHIIPAGLNRKNFERYRRGSSSRVEFKEFPGRNHFGVLGGPGWEELADFVIGWAERQLDTR